MAAQSRGPTTEADVVARSTWRLAFSILFVFLAGIQAWRHTFDPISLAFLALAASPFILPLLRGRVKSFEIAGLNVELLEAQAMIKTQEIKLAEQQNVINQLVVYSMAFYLYEMLRDFRKCEQGSMSEYKYLKSHESRLRYLRDHGYMEQTFVISKLSPGENIAGRVKLTPVGRFYVETREKYEHRGVVNSGPEPRNG